MATLQERLDAAVTDAEADAALFHAIIHGDDSTTVVTESGSVDSVAKAIAGIGDTSNQALKDLSNVDGADLRGAVEGAGGESAFFFYAHEQAVPDMTVRVDAGRVFDGGDVTEVAAQDTAAFAAPATYPRIDRIVLDRATGAVEVVAGTEAAAPVPPAVPAGKSTIAQVALATATSAVTSSLITDERDPSFYTLVADQVATAHLQDGAVTEDKIADAAVSGGKIAAGSVTQAHLASGVGGAPTGAVMPYLFTTPPSGWLLLDGGTIGDAGSGADRESADYQALFEGLWDSMADSEAPVTGGRGASANADWTAGKVIALPDARGRAVFGLDDMRSPAAGRVTAAGSGIDGDTLGASGGDETHTLTSTEMPSHTHAVGISGSSGGSYANYSTTGNTGSLTTTSAGGNGAHNNMPPALMLNFIVKV